MSYPYSHEHTSLRPSTSAQQTTVNFMTRQMFDASCTNCGKQCKVPFKPAPNRPVYCRDCYPVFKK